MVTGLSQLSFCHLAKKGLRRISWADRGVSEMSKEPRLIIVGGPSGSGKTSTAAFIAEKYPLIVHYRQQLTTRQPRENEYNHRPYIYLANGELEEMRKRGEIVVITDFAGNFYAYDNRFVQSVKAHFGQGKSIVVDSIHSIHDWLRFSQETQVSCT